MQLSFCDHCGKQTNPQTGGLTSAVPSVSLGMATVLRRDSGEMVCQTCFQRLKADIKLAVEELLERWNDAAVSLYPPTSISKPPVPDVQQAEEAPTYRVRVLLSRQVGDETPDDLNEGLIDLTTVNVFDDEQEAQRFEERLAKAAREMVR
jgi:hypothetical protein